MTLQTNYQLATLLLGE